MDETSEILTREVKAEQETKSVDTFAVHDSGDDILMREPGEIHVRSEISMTDKMI